MTFEQMQRLNQRIVRGVRNFTATSPVLDEVVWAGRGELLPDRAEAPDSRFNGMPSYDIDDGEIVAPRSSRRAYNLSGRYVGRFSRTAKNPTTSTESV